jgi:hypothetical protein
MAKQLVYQVEREIEDHRDYSLVGSKESHFMTLEIRALPYREGSDEATAYSVTWTITTPELDGLEIFYTSTAGYCGYQRVEGTARELVRRTDQYVGVIREAANEARDDI